MNTVTINTATPYKVLIHHHILSSTGDYVQTVHPLCNVAIISDSNVWPIYGKTVEQSLSDAGYNTLHYCFPAGEESKNTDTYLKILNFLAEKKLTRSDLIVALGGGVTGDMAGFAAATYLRGISYIQIPTSLLAMVDSSVGGKTAIDLPYGKNLVGAFYQPKLVLCDLDALSTLPDKYFLDGCAEVIKYAVLYDPSLFAHLQSKQKQFDRQYVVSRCVELKRDVVSTDELDRGARQKLNLGHTFGHSIEANSSYTISHGFAVAIGMNMAAKVGTHLGLCNTDVCESINKLLTSFSLPVSTTFTADQLVSCALNDKKRFGDTVNLILPHRIGDCAIHKVAVEELESIIEAGI